MSMPSIVMPAASSPTTDVQQHQVTNQQREKQFPLITSGLGAVLFYDHLGKGQSNSHLLLLLVVMDFSFQDFLLQSVVSQCGIITCVSINQGFFVLLTSVTT
jgi:hypothetical protein